jgi:hypothetical protein
MWLQFLFEQTRFAIHIFAALVFFAVFWLHFDAWNIRKTTPGTLRILGFGFLALSFLTSAILVESTILDAPIFGAETIRIIYLIIRSLGYLFIIFGQLIDPLIPRPKYSAVFVFPQILPLGIKFMFLPLLFLFQPILCVISGLLYLRRATIGLEDHLKPLAYSLIILSFSELLGLSSLYKETSNIYLFNLTSSFGPVWIFQQIMLLIAMTILGRWIFGYLLKQFQTQIFMIYTFTVLTVFLITTITFSALLVKNVQDESIKNIETDAKVLAFTLENKKSEALANAVAFAQNQLVIAAIIGGDKKTLAGLTEQNLLSKNVNSLIVVGSGGQVLSRGEDRDRLGDSMSNDLLIKRVMTGQTISSITSIDGVLAPTLRVVGAAPIMSADSIVGAVLYATDIDNAFVDGLKKATGLDSAVYGNNIMSVSTFESGPKSTQIIGIKEERLSVKDAVLTRGNRYTGSLNIANVLYFATYEPVLNIDKNPIGMLMVGKPQFAVLTSAGRSIELTFLVAVILIIISVIPSYLISKYISIQIE